MSRQSTNSYNRILKSSALLGGASVFNVVFAALRTKLLAVWLGPTLFGVMGLYVSITGMLGTVTSLGIGQSAVRDIAEAAESGDQQRVARVIQAYRRLVWITGIAGLVLALGLALPLSQFTFGTATHVWPLMALAVTVLFNQLQSGQGALVQGMRRVQDLSAITIASAIGATLVALPVVAVFKGHAVVPFLISVSGVQLAATWWFARRVRVSYVYLSWHQTWDVARPMVLLGLTFLVMGIVAAVSAYGVRFIIQRRVGESSVGLYHAAFTFSGIYVGFILQAMGGDYYPRLAGIAQDEQQRSRLVNEQLDAAVLLATPALLASLMFSDLLIPLFYSMQFERASAILRWQVLGMLGRIVSNPLTFLLIARSDKSAIVIAETTACVTNLALTVVCVAAFGVVGAGIGFAGSYLVYAIVVCHFVKRRHAWEWTKATANIVLASMAAVLATFATASMNSSTYKMLTQSAIFIITLMFCFRGLDARLGDNPFTIARRALARCRRPVKL